MWLVCGHGCCQRPAGRDPTQPAADPLNWRPLAVDKAQAWPLRAGGQRQGQDSGRECHK